jgi:surface antigen
MKRFLHKAKIDLSFCGSGYAEAWKNGATGKWPVDTEPPVGSVAWWAAASNNDYFGYLAIVASVTNNGNT